MTAEAKAILLQELEEAERRLVAECERLTAELGVTEITLYAVRNAKHSLSKEPPTCTS